MTFKYTELGTGDFTPPERPDATQSDNEPDDLTRVSKVWAYLVDHSTNIDVAILEMLNGENISHIPWTPIVHEIADAVNYVLAQENDTPK